MKRSSNYQDDSNVLPKRKSDGSSKSEGSEMSENNNSSACVMEGNINDSANSQQSSILFPSTEEKESLKSNDDDVDREQGQKDANVEVQAGQVQEVQLNSSDEDKQDGNNDSDKSESSSRRTNDDGDANNRSSSGEHHSIITYKHNYVTYNFPKDFLLNVWCLKDILSSPDKISPTAINVLNGIDRMTPPNAIISLLETHIERTFGIQVVGSILFCYAFELDLKDILQMYNLANDSSCLSIFKQIIETVTISTCVQNLYLHAEIVHDIPDDLFRKIEEEYNVLKFVNEHESGEDYAVYLNVKHKILNNFKKLCSRMHEENVHLFSDCEFQTQFAENNSANLELWDLLCTKWEKIGKTYCKLVFNETRPLLLEVAMYFAINGKRETVDYCLNLGDGVKGFITLHEEFLKKYQMPYATVLITYRYETTRTWTSAGALTKRLYLGVPLGENDLTCKTFTALSHLGLHHILSLMFGSCIDDENIFDMDYENRKSFLHVALHQQPKRNVRYLQKMKGCLGAWLKVEDIANVLCLLDLEGMKTFFNDDAVKICPSRLYAVFLKWSFLKSGLDYKDIFVAQYYPKVASLFMQLKPLINLKQFDNVNSPLLRTSNYITLKEVFAFKAKHSNTVKPQDTSN